MSLVYLRIISQCSRSTFRDISCSSLQGSVSDRLAPVLKTIFHQCVISYTYSQSNSDGSVLKTEPLDLNWLQENVKNCFKDWSQSRSVIICFIANSRPEIGTWAADNHY